MAPTPEESAAVTLRSLYGISSVAFVVIGIQLFMCIYGLAVFLETSPKTRRGRGPYIIISFLILILFTISQVADGYQSYELVYKSTNVLDAIKLRKLDDHTWWRVGSSSCLWIVNWIGDGMLIYRCYIVWHEKRWLCVLPGIAYMASIGVSIYTVYTLVTSTPQTPRFNTRALSAWIFLSVSVNCIVTLLISYKLLRIRREMSKVLPDYNRKIYLGVVAILVESALPLSVSGIAFACVTGGTSIRARIVNAVFLFLWFSFNALSPQMIIFRVTIGRSWAHRGPGSDSARFGQSTSTDASTNIEFNRRNGNDTFLHQIPKQEFSTTSERDSAFTGSRNLGAELSGADGSHTSFGVQK